MSRKQKLDSETMLMPPKKIVLSLDNACSSICTNAGGTLLAVVGRKVFKVVKISPDQFEVIVNLRDLPAKQLNLNYSNNDVQFNPRDDCQLASAPTNGSVIIWDINKRTKNKQCHAFESVHTRAVNKLSYHPRDSNLLLSGSQDSNMNFFDTRMKNVVCTFKGPDSVRDVKFATLPGNDNYFAACYDNGALQIWDRRHTDHHFKVISAHSGPVYCLDWHPELENSILSAGRDKLIKGFEGVISSGRIKDKFTVSTPSSVARARWRPGHKHHISSCSHFLDNTVQVWDFRRPYIPFASFTEHSDDVTDILWLNEQVLISCSKDGKVIQQLFCDAFRPVERATPVGVSFGPDGSLVHACSESLVHKAKATQNSVQYGSSRHSSQPMSFRKPDHDPYPESFLLFTSSLKEHPKHSESNMEQFIRCAKLFKLHGLPMHELCDHNYKIACDLDRQDVAQTWLFLKLLYCSNDTDCSTLGLLQTRAPSRHGAGSRLSNNQAPQIVVDGGSETQSSILVKESITTDCRVSATRMDGPPSIDSAPEELEDDVEESNPPDVNAALDFFESNDQDSDIGQAHNIVEQPPQQGWGQLPVESIQLRHDLVVRPPSPDRDTSSAVSTMHSVQESSTSVKQTSKETILLNNVTVTKPPWDFSPVVADMLKFYAKQGDVQMSVSALLVLGDKSKGLVSESVLEQWFSSYIDLLIRYELWTVSALVIRLCPLPKINEMSQQSTTYHIGCGGCNKYIDNKGWQCLRCGEMGGICSVCNGTVYGLFVWCHVCGHGGHLKHLNEWYGKHQQCPAGCGHNCVLNGSQS